MVQNNVGNVRCSGGISYHVTHVVHSGVHSVWRLLMCLSLHKETGFMCFLLSWHLYGVGATL